LSIGAASEDGIMTYAPRILALDLASRSGWACGYPYDRVPRSGSIRFTKLGASLGAIYCHCREWLDDFIFAHDPDQREDVDLIVFEAPMAPIHMASLTNAHTIRLLIGLCAVVEEFAFANRIDVREAKVSDVRRHFIGAGRFKRPEAKAATIETCHRLGWAPADDNAADALALWHYQASIFDPKLAVQTSPLFRRRIA
jgi:crossover junction endodeoxyribonuclease RuvC